MAAPTATPGMSCKTSNSRTVTGGRLSSLALSAAVITPALKRSAPAIGATLPSEAVNVTLEPSRDAERSTALSVPLFCEVPKTTNSCRRVIWSLSFMSRLHEGDGVVYTEPIELMPKPMKQEQLAA